MEASRVAAVVFTIALAGCAAGPKPATLPLVAAPPAIDLGRLFDELSDLALLARRVDPPYTSELASSFDPSSRAAKPGDPDWFANKDFARPEQGEPLTVLDISGPGVITRIWSANPSGVVRIYLDGAATPVIEAELTALLTGAVAPFSPPFAFEVAGGKNLYFPIPFARGCRVTVTTDAKRLYYQLDYRRYAASVRVESFSAPALVRAEASRARAAARLEAAAVLPSPLAAAESFSLTVEPGQPAQHRIQAARGGSAIRELRVRPGRLDAEALRGTILSLMFDGETTVHVPLGDFFATGPGVAPVRGLPVTVDVEQGLLIARWVMPFRVNASIGVTGTLGDTFDVGFEVVTEPFQWDDRALYFGATWRAPSWQESEPARDWNVLRLEGTGTYVGTLLNLINGNAQWWGEGDEKIYVDRAAFPSHFGTGTEDYFGYAYCSNAVFSAPFVGQTRSDARQNYGALSMYRVHTLDAIPFLTELRFDFEIHHWGEQPVPLELDAIGFYYARPGARVDPVATDPASYRVPVLPLPPDGVTPSEYTCGG